VCPSWNVIHHRLQLLSYRFQLRRAHRILCPVQFNSLTTQTHLQLAIILSTTPQIRGCSRAQPMFKAYRFNFNFTSMADISLAPPQCWRNASNYGNVVALIRTASSIPKAEVFAPPPCSGYSVFSKARSRRVCGAQTTRPLVWQLLWQTGASDQIPLNGQDNSRKTPQLQHLPPAL